MQFRLKVICFRKHIRFRHIRCLAIQYLRELRAAAERYRESGLPILACGDSARRHELSIFRPNHRSPSYFFGDLSSTQSCGRGLSETEKGFLSIERYPLPLGQGAKREPGEASIKR